MRLKIIFPDRESYKAAQELSSATKSGVLSRHRELGASKVQVQNEKRFYLSVEPAIGGVETAEAEFDRQLEFFQKHFGAEIVEDYKYDLETDVFDPGLVGPDNPNNPSLDDVLKLIDAPGAWNESTGKDVAIAVVDTGIDGNRLEIPSTKRVGQWQAVNDVPWTDYHGHGTMCAVIAAGTRASGGSFDGVAPDASLICCKTHFYDAELGAIYDYLEQLSLSTNLKIVATNSWGKQTGKPPAVASHSVFLPALEDALAAGVHVFFSAGNYHKDAGGSPGDCQPNSIWLHKGRSDVMTVAACDMDLQMWYYSSRGPGQHYGDRNTNAKPDVTAPTPRDGRIVFGSTINSLADGWGTSGACPQVAGLAALLLSKKPSLSRDQLVDAIIAGAVKLPHPSTCCGHGLINCSNSLQRI